jgi:hypothetical protein
MVTHLTTNPPVEGLTCGEQTGSGVFLRLWPNVLALAWWMVLVLHVVTYERQSKYLRGVSYRIIRAGTALAIHDCSHHWLLLADAGPGIFARMLQEEVDCRAAIVHGHHSPHQSTQVAQNVKRVKRSIDM